MTHPRVRGSGYVMTGWLGCQPPPAKVWWLWGHLGRRPSARRGIVPACPSQRLLLLWLLQFLYCMSLFGGRATDQPPPPPPPPTARVGQGHGRADLWWVGPTQGMAGPTRGPGSPNRGRRRWGGGRHEIQGGRVIDGSRTRCGVARQVSSRTMSRGPRFPKFGNSRRLNAGWVWDTGEGFLLKDQREESL